jgi:hypothetical protein
MHALNDTGSPLGRGSVWAALAVAVSLGAVSLGSACTRKPVVIVAEPPPLAVPAVPPRLVGPVQVAEEAPPPVEESPQEPAPRPAARTPRVTRGTADPTPPKPEGSTAETPKPGEQAETPPVSGEQPPSLLRTVETADDLEATRRVKAILGRAEQNLSKINYKTLSNTARMQHDQVTRFIAQAEDALRVRSFTFARYLADKAEVLSGSLVNR